MELELSTEQYLVLKKLAGSESDPVAGAALTTHAGLSTSAHGGIVSSVDSRLTDARTPLAHTHVAADTTGTAVLTADSRLSDARTPTVHSASHQNGGGDEISVVGLSGLLADAQTPLGHVHAAGDTTSGQFAMARLASGVADGTKFIRDDGTLQSAGGGNHAASHQNGGGDEVSVVGLSGLLADGQTPLAHASSHQDGGADEISVAGLSGALADPQPPIIGGGAAQAVAGNDSRLTDARTPTVHSHVAADILGTAVLNADARLSDARTPTAHAASHSDLSSDPVTITNLAGFPGGSTFLRADATFAAPPGGGGDIALSKTAPSTSQVITTGTSAYVIGPYEIVAGTSLEIAAGACLEIG